MGKERPNFILINSDQQRADCLSIEQERKGLVTPYLDNLAAQGVRFTAAYATCPVCIPQRMSLMSGQLQSTHGVLHNAGICDWPIEHTLPDELHRASYETALMGRDMHLWPMEKGYGFERQEICTAYPCSYTRFLEEHAPKWAGNSLSGGAGVNCWNAIPWHLPDHLHYTHWTTEMAIRFLKERDTGRPFFLTVGYNPPHTPLNPPQFYFDRYHRMADLDGPVYGDWAVPPKNDGLGQGVEGNTHVYLQGELLRSCLAGYYGLINHLDTEVGRLLLFLQLSGLRRNTYLIFTSDHGEMLGDHYMFHKCRPYEGAARIPFFVTGPGIENGQTCDRPVGWHDLMPTVLDLAGVDTPDTVDGASLRPFLEGSSSGSWREFLHGELAESVAPDRPVAAYPVDEPNFHFVTDGREKFVWFAHSGREQFFDLVADPDECHDRIADPGCQERIGRWRQRLIETLKDRPEGFTDGAQLFPGRPYASRMPHAQAIVDCQDPARSKWPSIIDAVFP